jgi:hypothetical protein
MRLQRVEHRTLRNRAVDGQWDFAADMRQISQMEWEHYADRGHLNCPPTFYLAHFNPGHIRFDDRS